MKMPKDLHDVAERVGWTFVQAFLGVLVASSAMGWNKAVFGAALAAGVGAALVVVKEYAKAQIEND